MGLFVFVLFQSILVSYRFTRSFNTIERQRAQLVSANLKLRTQEKLRRDAESESEVLGIGISVIMLNLGMYLGVPAIAVVGIKRKF